MRRKLRRHFAFLMAVLMMLSLMGVQVLAEGVQVEAVQTTEGTDCTVLPEETDAEETSRSEMQKPDAKESPPESGVVTEEGKSTDSEKISVALKDEILTKGSLTADVSGTTESDQIAYQWQVSENGQWKDIEDTATVDSRKQSYEVARDGAQKTFRVKVTVNEAVTVYSSEYKVNYYDKLQNGSFETPKVSDAGTLTYKNAHFIQVANGTNDLYWKTTAKGAYFGSGTQRDYYIEIADGSRSYYGNTVNDPKPVYNISSAAQGNQFAQYRLGKVYLIGEDVQKDIPAALQFLTAAAEQGNQYAQYTLGKLYLMGKDVPKNKETAVRWFTLSAAQGNIYAQFFLDHMDDFKDPSVLLAGTRLLHHMSRVFADNAPPLKPPGQRTDRKLLRKLREKKQAQGHARDDNEQTMSL